MTSPGAKRILVVDDEQSLRGVICNALRQAGFTVLEATSAEEGLVAAKAQQPDLILSDIIMQQEDGFTLLAHLRSAAATATIPVILMTGDVDRGAESGVRHGMELGADDFLHKPFSKEILLAAVQARLRKQDLIRAQAERARSCLSQMLEATDDVVLLAQAATRKVVYVNQAARRFFGMAPEQELGDFALERLFNPAVAERLLSDCLPAARQHGNWHGELTFLTPTGAEVSMRAAVLAHKAEDGQEEYYSVVAHDLGGIQQSAPSPKRGELNLKTLTVSDLDGVALIKQDGRVVFSRPSSRPA